jgi:fumarate reductase subunit C
MSRDTTYSKYQPNVYRERMPIFWWVSRLAHIRFITRELTSVFVASFAIELLFLVRDVYAGPQAYALFVVWLQTPLSLALHGVGFLFVVFHSFTWFNLAPKAMVIRVGTIRIPDMAIVVGNFLGWIVFSLLIAWIILG